MRTICFTDTSQKQNCIRLVYDIDQGKLIAPGRAPGLNVGRGSVGEGLVGFATRIVDHLFAITWRDQRIESPHAGINVTIELASRYCGES